MGVMKDGFFDGDIEKGEGIFKLDTKMMEGKCESNRNGDVESVTSLVCSSGDGDLKSVRVVVVEERVNGDGEKRVAKEKAKSMSAKKPPKPPRPPRGLSLDSTDQKLIRELHEIARLKRARVERMKALKKAKETRVASSKSQLFATLLTTLFCLVLLLQGISSRTTTNIQGPPFSSEVAEQHNTISLRHYPFSSTANLSGLGSDPARLVEQVSGVGTKEQEHTAIE